MIPVAVFVSLISGSPSAGFYPTNKVFAGTFCKKEKKEKKDKKDKKNKDKKDSS